MHLVVTERNSLLDKQVFAVGVIWCGELKSKNIEMDIETLSFHINPCLHEYEEIYNGLSNEINRLSFLPLLSQRC